MTQTLFHGNGDWRYNAGLNYLGARHELMTEGYLLCANRLVESISETHMGIDFVVYPVIYLYRHWFELRLKNIIDEGRRLLEEGSGYPQSHALHTLWPLAQQIISKVWSESERPSQYDLIDAAVAEFEKFDADSQSFRYPVDRKGNNTLEGLQHINLEHFATKMEEIAQFLDGASSGISAYLQDRGNGES